MFDFDDFALGFSPVCIACADIRVMTFIWTRVGFEITFDTKLLANHMSISFLNTFNSLIKKPSFVCDFYVKFLYYRSSRQNQVILTKFSYLNTVKFIAT